MKRAISIAAASAMIMGMGVNSFADVTYNTSSSDTAAWPTDFRFEEPIFVIDKDGQYVTGSSTALEDSENYAFYPGDEIFMPLSAADQKVYTVTGNTISYPAVSSKTISLYASLADTTSDNSISIYEGSDGSIQANDFTYTDTTNKVVYYYGTLPDVDNYENTWRFQEITSLSYLMGGYYQTDYDDIVTTVDASSTDIYETLTFYYTYDTTGGTGFTWYSDASGTTPITSYTYSGSDVTTALTYNSSDFPTLFGVTSPADDVLTPTGVSTSALVGYYTTESDAYLKNTVTIQVKLPALSAVSGSDGKYVNGVLVSTGSNSFTDTVTDGIYTGNIDSSWSINLSEESSNIVSNAEFYRATTSDIAKYGDVFEAKGVYIKVTLKDFFDSVDDATLKYYLYISDNDTSYTTNKVWVSGTYKNNNTKYVNFSWTNDANTPAVWEVEKGENGTAVFDFADKAFFTVKMYSEEKMYLDLSTAYQTAVAGEWDADFDSFYRFQGTNANFAREGELILSSDDENLYVYQITDDGDMIPMDAAYVEDYQIVHTGEKISGYVFDTKELGNFVLSADDLGVDDDGNVDEETVLDEDEEDDIIDEPDIDYEPDDTTETEVEKNTPSADNATKNNPNTGADDFVGLAVTLALVSVASAGVLALKR